jgi:hypothetical protein
MKTVIFKFADISINFAALLEIIHNKCLKIIKSIIAIGDKQICTLQEWQNLGLD